MSERLHLLIVDDVRENLFVLAELLQEFLPEYEVREALGAAEAMQRIEPDTGVVISDVQMPGTSGIELCSLIKASPQLAHIPVLLITSHRSTSPVRVEALSAGAQDFISRPIDSEELVVKIRNALDQRLLNDGLKHQRDTLRQELSLAEAQHRTLFMHATDAIFITDIRGRILDVNFEGQHLLGQSADALKGRNVNCFVAKGSPEIELSHGARTKVESLQTRFLGPQDDLVHVEVRNRLVDLGESEVLWVIARDVTESLRTERALQEKEASLKRALARTEDANRAKTEFVSSMSHEIRTPLNGIMGMLQLMRESVQDPELRGYAEMALEASYRLTSLLSDILDLSRVEARKLKILSEPFHPVRVLDQMQGLFKPMVDQKALTLHIEASPDLPETVCGDSVRVFQILTNLMGNALKFTDEGGITVRADFAIQPDTGLRLLFEVEDTGRGIPEKALGSLGRPFTQLNRQGYLRQDQGVGLGLSICARLVELMNGSLCLSSEEDKGTSVYFDVLVSREVCEIPEAERFVRGDSLTLDELRVLVAEDDRTSGLFLKKMLAKHGIEVTLAKDGKRALELLAEIRHDVVLMDIQMPVMDGVTATRAIRAGKAGKNNTDIPIVALTAHASKEERAVLLGAGMDSHLPKPVDVAALLALLQDLLPDAG